MDDNVIIYFIIGIVLIIGVLLAMLAYMYFKDKMSNGDNTEKENRKDDEIEEKKAQKSIFKFMEFDTVEDNMIVQDGGKRYLMVLECKGINYDLLSSLEKNGVEQGFISFLNALKYDIQIYVQTRKVNLMQSTARYRERLRVIENDMQEEERKYEEMQRRGNYSKAEMMKELKEVTKKRNLFDYANDVIQNTEQMSEDSDLTTKSYYIIVPYYTEEITSVGDYDKKEISSMAFSELYTRAQAIASSLNECDVRARIMNSQEIIELLFVAYNREQHDLYDFDEYMTQSGNNTFYSVSEDVLDKRMQALDEEIVKKANERAVEAFQRASRRTRDKRKETEERERRMKEYIDSIAAEIIESEQVNIGKDMVDRSKQEIKNMREEDNEKEAIRAERMKKINSPEDELEDAIEFEKEDTVKEVKEEAPKKEKKKLSDLTPEEIERRRRIIKRRKMMKEKEAMKNAKNE